MTHSHNKSIVNPSVRLSAGNRPIGSGFIVHSVESHLLYVLTARHCLLSFDPAVVITVDLFEESTASFADRIPVSLAECLCLETTIDYDIALLPLRADQLPGKLTTLNLYKSIPKGSPCSFIGFPASLQGKRPHEVEGKTSISAEYRTNIKTFQQFESNESSSSESTQGYSGSGLLIDAEASRALAGIITHYHPTNNEFTAYSFARVNELLARFSRPLICLLEPRPGIKASDDSTSFDFFQQVQSTLTAADQFFISLQPRQALTLVEPLVQSIPESTISTSKRDQLLARCQSIRVFSQADLQLPVDVNTELIAIYLLDKANRKYQERALLAYFDLQKYDEADELAEQILGEDGENPRAWSVYHQLHPSFPPPQSVTATVDYRMGLLGQLATASAHEQTESMINLFAEELAQQTLPDQLNRSNIYYWNYVAQAAMARGFRQANQLMGLDKPTGFRQNAHLMYARNLFERLCSAIDKTPFREYEHFVVSRFNFCLCEYLLTDEAERESLMSQEMYQLFIGDQSKRPSFLKRDMHTPIIETMPDRLLELLTFLLQQNQPLLVIDVMKSVREDPTPDAYFLLGKAHAFLDQKEPMIEAYKQYLNHQPTLDQHIVSNCFILIRDLLLAGQPNNEIARWLTEGKTFTHWYLEPLLNAYCWCGSSDTREKAKQAADQVYPHGHELSHPVKRGLAIVYSMLQEWAIAKTLWKELIEESDQASEERWNYIIALYNDNTEYEEIQKQFEHWRVSFIPDEQLINLELNHYRTLNIYDKLADVSLFGLNHFPASSQFWLDAIRGLNELKNGQLLLPLLDERILQVSLPAMTRLWIASIYLAYNSDVLGLEACYRTLKENWANPDVKSAYLSLANQFKHVFSKSNPDQASPDMVVQVKGPAKSEWLELTPEALNFYQVAKAALDRAVGQTFQLASPLGGQVDTYQVTQILNKYAGQQPLIFQEIDQKAYHGGPFHLVTLPESEDPTDILRHVETIIGPKQKERDAIRERLMLDFAQGKIGFYQLAQGAFGSNPVGAWQHITSNPNGFPIYPLVSLKKHLPPITLDASVSFVLDFSALLTLYTVSTQHKCTLLYREKPFIVSRFTVDFITSELDKTMDNEEPGIFLGYHNNQFMPFTFPDDFQQQRTAYWSSLNDWISLNCQVDYAWERLQLQREYANIDQVFRESNYYKSSFLDTILLANKPRHILVSDDTVHFTTPGLGLGLRVTTEWYLKTIQSAQFAADLWKDLVKLNLRGLSLTGAQLFDAYTSETEVGSRNAFFQQAIRSFVTRDNPATNTVLELINFIKYLFSMKLPLADKQATKTKKNAFKAIMHDAFPETIPLHPFMISFLMSQIDYAFGSPSALSEFIKHEFRLYFIEALSSSQSTKK